MICDRNYPKAENPPCNATTPLFFFIIFKNGKNEAKICDKTIKRTPYYRPNDEKSFSFFSKPLPPPVAS